MAKRMNELGQVLGGLVPRLRHSGPRTALVQGAWTRIVGPSLAARSRVAGLVRGRLEVVAADALWARQLDALAPVVVAKIKEIFPSLAVERLVVAVGEVVTAREAAAAPPPAATPCAPRAVASEAMAIHDEALRAHTLAVAARYLARRAPRP